MPLPPAPRPLLQRIFSAITGRPALPIITSFEQCKQSAPLCNGEATGLACRHYLTMISGYGGAADSLDERLGTSRFSVVRRQRRCMLHPTAVEDLGNNGSKFRLACSGYEASSRRYDHAFETMQAGPTAAETEFVKNGTVQQIAQPLSPFAAVGGSPDAAARAGLEASLAAAGITITKKSADDPAPTPAPAAPAAEPASPTPTPEDTNNGKG